MKNWIVSDQDRELFDRELETFVPQQIFDAHAHWYHEEQFAAGSFPKFLTEGPRHAGWSGFQAALAELTPGRSTEGLFFPYPHPSLNIEQANQFLADELTHSRKSRGQMLITPLMDPEFIRETVRRHKFVGLKCYHIYANHENTFHADIEEFLPEPQVQIAHEEGLSITLHMVKPRALAEPSNQVTIRRYCERYPSMQLILAHAARGFNPHHTMLGINSLRGLKNVWFDTSVVTDSGALEAILKTFGPQRLLYGSDFPVSHLRGRCVALGDSFFWISAENTQLQVPYADLQLSLVGFEALRTLKVAAMAVGLTDTQVEEVFSGNARQLWNLS